MHFKITTDKKSIFTWKVCIFKHGHCYVKNVEKCQFSLSVYICLPIWGDLIYIISV